MMSVRYGTGLRRLAGSAVLVRSSICFCTVDVHHSSSSGVHLFLMYIMELLNFKHMLLRIVFDVPF